MAVNAHEIGDRVANEIIRSCDTQTIQNILTLTIRSYVKTREYVSNNDVFKICMFICKFMVSDRFTDPKPTMFTVYGSFNMRAVCEDELHEMDIQTCIRTDPPIMQIKSNYGHTYHSTFVVKTKTKPKKNKKKKRGVQGNGSSFNSQATITVRLQPGIVSGILNNKDYGVKLFRKLKYVIPHCVKIDNSDAKAVLNIVINTLNDTWPGRDYYVDWKDMKTPMHNFKFQLKSSPEKCVEKCGRLRCRDICQTMRIDLQLLTNILKLIWRDENMANQPDREETGNYAGLLVRFHSGSNDGKTVTVCIQKSGKITINGSVSVHYYMAIYEWCNWIIAKYSDHILYELREPTPVISDSSSSSDDENNSNGND